MGAIKQLLVDSCEPRPPDLVDDLEASPLTDILVVGAGPVGLTMALELARHGCRCRIVDRLAAPSGYCKAIGVTPRTLEVWDDMGIAARMIENGLWITGLRSIVAGGPAHDEVVDLSALPYANLGLPQYATEALLGEELAKAGVRVERGVALAALEQRGDGVEVELDHADGSKERAAFRFVVGCDGAHSAVRHLTGIGFPGEGMGIDFMLGDVEIAWDVPRGMAVFSITPKENAPPISWWSCHCPAAIATASPWWRCPSSPVRARQRPRITASPRSDPVRRSASCRRWRTGCCPAGRGSPRCDGLHCSAYRCGLPTDTGSATPSSPAMPPTSIRPPAARG